MNRTDVAIPSNLLGIIPSEFIEAWESLHLKDRRTLGQIKRRYDEAVAREKRDELIRKGFWFTAMIMTIGGIIAVFSMASFLLLIIMIGLLVCLLLLALFNSRDSGRKNLFVKNESHARLADFMSWLETIGVIECGLVKITFCKEGQVVEMLINLARQVLIEEQHFDLVRTNLRYTVDAVVTSAKSLCQARTHFNDVFSSVVGSHLVRGLKRHEIFDKARRR